jgi:acetylornithine deacetylase/succinyl-diaminopimelate desuccinylase-like protein
MWPARTPLSSPYVRKIAKAVEDAHGAKPLIYPCAGGSLPTYVFTEVLDLPVISVPYANADESNHAPNENLTIENFVKGIKTCCSVFDRIGQK